MDKQTVAPKPHGTDNTYQHLPCREIVGHLPDGTLIVKENSGLEMALAAQKVLSVSAFIADVAPKAIADVFIEEVVAGANKATPTAGELVDAICQKFDVPTFIAAEWIERRIVDIRKFNE